MSLAIDEVEDLVEAAIGRLDATAHQHTSGDSWTRSPVPLTVAQPGAVVRHLTYSATIERASATPTGGGPGSLRLEADLRVLYLYRLRQTLDGAQDPAIDARRASRAARDLLGAVCRAHPSITVEVREAYRAGRILDGEYQEAEIRCLLYFDTPIPGV